MNYKITDITLDMFPDSFRDFIDLLVEINRDAGLPEEQAQERGKAAAMKLCELAGGDQLYIPKSDSVLRPLIHDEITHAWQRGVAFEALAQKYNLSVDRVRAICRDNMAKCTKSVFDFIEELDKSEVKQ